MWACRFVYKINQFHRQLAITFVAKDQRPLDLLFIFATAFIVADA